MRIPLVSTSKSRKRLALAQETSAALEPKQKISPTTLYTAMLIREQDSLQAAVNYLRENGVIATTFLDDMLNVKGNIFL